MRLLDSGTLRLTHFFDRELPEYVILSHCWGDDEVTFHDIQDVEKATQQNGFLKLKNFCQKAKSDGFRWVWMDTCCIDKSSSAELSEAINSMYLYYARAEICYVHLEDVSSGEIRWLGSALNTCKWFTRGWTLQELIAPQIVEFYTSDWIDIGTKASMVEIISKLTKIDKKVLLHTARLDEFNVATRMQWAADRKTTRKEDEAYSLMGIFGVNMPLLYGEGPRAFQRLQEEIMKITEDYTLFAWSEFVKDETNITEISLEPALGNPSGILAESPAGFSDKENWRRHWHPYSELHTSIFTAAQSMPAVASIIGEYMTGDPPVLTSRGLLMTVPIWRKNEWEHRACLTCTRSNNDLYFLCVSLRPALPVHEVILSTKDSTFMYTPSNMGFLKFVPVVEILHDLLKYSRIYLTSNRDLVPKEPAWFFSYVKIQMDQKCNISDHCPLWSYKEAAQADQPFPIDYCLRQPPPHVKHPIQAVFALQVNMGVEVLSFIVAFGTLAHGLPWCDIIAGDPPHGKRKRVVERAEEMRADRDFGAQEEDKDDSATEEYWKKIRELPKISLSGVFCGESSFFSGDRLPGNNPIVNLFKNTSDRSLSKSKGIVVTVSARRTSGKHWYTLNIAAKEESDSAPPSPAHNQFLGSRFPQLVKARSQLHNREGVELVDWLDDLRDASLFLQHGSKSMEEKSSILSKDRCDPPRSRTTTEYASSVETAEQSLTHRRPEKTKSKLASSIGSLMQSSTNKFKE